MAKERLAIGDWLKAHGFAENAREGGLLSADAKRLSRARRQALLSRLEEGCIWAYALPQRS